MIYTSVSEMTGRTPLLELTNTEKALKLPARILAKCEFMNPTGSAKDRAAREIIDDYERKGLLEPGGVVIEATSGNTGIGLASVCASRGYHAMIIMPDTMSEERIRLMRAYGADVVLSDGKKGMAGSLEKVAELKEKYPDAVEAGQFVNPSNAEAHYKTTGPEIWADLDGKVDAFVAGVGTGGTLTGVGRYLRARNPKVRLFAVEPDTSPLISKGVAGPHKLQGIGANFIPGIFDRSLVDEVITVSAEAAGGTARALGAREGILCGITSGAAMWAALEIAKRPDFAGANVVALLPDTGERYLSTWLFA